MLYVRRTRLCVQMIQERRSLEKTLALVADEPGSPPVVPPSPSIAPISPTLASPSGVNKQQSDEIRAAMVETSEAVASLEAQLHAALSMGKEAESELRRWRRRQ